MASFRHFSFHSPVNSLINSMNAITVISFMKVVGISRQCRRECKTWIVWIRELAIKYLFVLLQDSPDKPNKCYLMFNWISRQFMCANYQVGRLRQISFLAWWTNSFFTRGRVKYFCQLLGHKSWGAFGKAANPQPADPLYEHWITMIHCRLMNT